MRTTAGNEPPSSDASRRGGAARGWRRAGGRGEKSRDWRRRVRKPTPPPATDPRYPMPPTWGRELRQLAPNVYAYTQGGGPNASNAGVSNTGMIAGPDFLMAIDATQGPLPARGFIAAAKQATGGKDFGRLINTHHHGDHVNGNQFFEHAEILSHPYCRQECLKADP